MIRASVGVVVGCYDGWEISIGILDEIAFARRLGLPVFYWEPGGKPPGTPVPPRERKGRL